MTINKATLAAQLAGHEMHITYTKESTGVPETFRATLREDAKPSVKTAERVLGEDLISVVNLDKQAWRTLKIANISKAEIIG